MKHIAADKPFHIFMEQTNLYDSICIKRMVGSKKRGSCQCKIWISPANGQPHQEQSQWDGIWKETAVPLVRWKA